jgi:HAD superfamily hydrolase (TIGR01549 family)
MTQLHGVVLDIDGTLVDSNDANARAWIEAMAEQGHTVSFEHVRPLIGMGGDKVLPEILNISKDSDEGKKISQRRKQIMKERYQPTLHAFPQARELLKRMHSQGLKLVVATSAEQDELQGLLRIIGPDVPDLFEQETTSQYAPKSKPNPEIMDAALEKSGLQSTEVVMIGDTAFDIEAATKAGVKTIALRCGGWSDNDLKGALAIYNDAADLFAHYDESPLGKGISTSAS